jgi:hypothetical protein
MTLKVTNNLPIDTSISLRLAPRILCPGSNEMSQPCFPAAGARSPTRGGTRSISQAIPGSDPTQATC